MTIVVDCDEHPLEQVTKQLNKLVNVLKIVELDQGFAVQRELLLVKVRADTATRPRCSRRSQLFRAKVVDVAQDAVTIEATGTRDKLEALMRGARAVRDQGTGAVRHGGRRPGRPVHHRPGAAPGRAQRLTPAR